MVSTDMIRSKSLMTLLLGTLFCIQSSLDAQNKPAPKGVQKKPTQNKPQSVQEQIKSKLPHQDGKSASPIPVRPVDPKTKNAVKLAATQIDAIIENRLKAEGQRPNAMANDAQIGRRLYLDIIGTIPSGRESFQFLSSSRSDKIEVLIDHLLDHPGYASHAFNYWADVLRIVDRSGGNTYIRPWADWVKGELRKNTPWDKMVFEMLTARGQVFDNPAVGYRLRDFGMPLDHLNNTIRVFLGTRIGCAQCHDHPFDKWTQRQFYELAALDGGVRTSLPRSEWGQKNMKATLKIVGERSREAGKMRQIERWNRYGVTETAAQLKYPHDYVYDDAKPGQVVKPSVLFGTLPEAKEGESRQEQLSRWIVSKDNDRFAKTLVNRLWKRAFGIGIFEPEDDLMDDTPISNPELLNYLTAKIKELNFDMKEFMRIIYHTRTYQRQVTYDDIDLTQPYYFPGPVLRRMTAEQVWDSVMVMIMPQPHLYQRPDESAYLAALNVSPNLSSLQLQNAVEQVFTTEADVRKADRLELYRGLTLRRASELPQPLPRRHFLRQFGQSDRQIISDSTVDGTVPQLLALFNGPVTHMILEAGSVMHREVIGSRGTNQLQVIFLSILGRYPTTSERNLAMQEIQYNTKNGEGNLGYGNVIWSLLNTREFLFIQ